MKERPLCRRCWQQVRVDEFRTFEYLRQFEKIQLCQDCQDLDSCRCPSEIKTLNDLCARCKEFKLERTC